MQTLEYWQKIAPKLKTILKFCEFFFWIFCEFFFLQSNVGEFLQKEKASKIFYFLSTVGRRLPRCRQMCPSNMIIVIRTCGWWWSRGGHLRLIRSHHISWQVLGNFRGGLFNVFDLVFSKVATDRSMDGMDGWCHKLFCDPHPSMNYCTWHLPHWTFLLFPPPSPGRISRQATMQLTPQSRQVSFSLWKSSFGCHLPKVMFRFFRTSQ